MTVQIRAGGDPLVKHWSVNPVFNRTDDNPRVIATDGKPAETPDHEINSGGLLSSPGNAETHTVTYRARTPHGDDGKPTQFCASALKSLPAFELSVFTNTL